MGYLQKFSRPKPPSQTPPKPSSQAKPPSQAPKSHHKRDLEDDSVDLFERDLDSDVEELFGREYDPLDERDIIDDEDFSYVISTLKISLGGNTISWMSVILLMTRIFSVRDLVDAEDFFRQEYDLSHEQCGERS